MAAVNSLLKSLRDRTQWVTYLHLRTPPWRHDEADACFSKWHDDASPYLQCSPQCAVTAALHDMGLTNWALTKNS